MKKITITTILSFGLMASGVAQDQQWTLEACMRYAVEHSPAVKKKIYTHNTYVGERSAAVASFFPTVSTSVSAQYNYGRSVDPETNTYNNTTTFNNYYGLATSIPLFTGGRLINEWLRSKSNVKMGKNDIQKAKDDLALEVMQAFADVLYYQGTIRMASEKLEESRGNLHRTRRQEELGLKGRADVAQFEAQVAADEYALTHQHNLFNTAMLTLKQKMNFPGDSLLQVDTLLPSVSFDPMGEDIAAIVDYAATHNPTARQIDFQWQDSKYQYRIAKGNLLPSIYFNAGISTNYFKNLKTGLYDGFSSQFKNNRGEYLGFTLSFPLFDGLSKLTNVRRYRNNLKIATETKTEVMRQLQNAIEQSVLDREGYAKEAIQMDKKVKADALAYRITVRKYEEGLMSPLDVQNSGNTLLGSKADLLQKKLMYMMKSRLVDYYKGKPLY
ncbi:MAG: TolC family protein [Parabacteroides sp.]